MATDPKQQHKPRPISIPHRPSSSTALLRVNTINEDLDEGTSPLGPLRVARHDGSTSPSSSLLPTPTSSNIRRLRFSPSAADEHGGSVLANTTTSLSFISGIPSSDMNFEDSRFFDESLRHSPLPSTRTTANRASSSPNHPKSEKGKNVPATAAKASPGKTSQVPRVYREAMTAVAPSLTARCRELMAAAATASAATETSVQSPHVSASHRSPLHTHRSQKGLSDTQSSCVPALTSPLPPITPGTKPLHLAHLMRQFIGSGERTCHTHHTGGGGGGSKTKNGKGTFTSTHPHSSLVGSSAAVGIASGGPLESDAALPNISLNRWGSTAGEAPTATAVAALASAFGMASSPVVVGRPMGDSKLPYDAKKDPHLAGFWIAKALRKIQSMPDAAKTKPLSKEKQNGDSESKISEQNRRHRSPIRQSSRLSIRSDSNTSSMRYDRNSSLESSLKHSSDFSSSRHSSAHSAASFEDEEDRRREVGKTRHADTESSGGLDVGAGLNRAPITEKELLCLRLLVCPEPAIPCPAGLVRIARNIDLRWLADILEDNDAQLRRELEEVPVLSGALSVVDGSCSRSTPLDDDRKTQSRSQLQTGSPQKTVSETEISNSSNCLPPIQARTAPSSLGNFLFSSDDASENRNDDNEVTATEPPPVDGSHKSVANTSEKNEKEKNEHNSKPTLASKIKKSSSLHHKNLQSLDLNCLSHDSTPYNIPGQGTFSASLIDSPRSAVVLLRNGINPYDLLERPTSFFALPSEGVDIQFLRHRKDVWDKNRIEKLEALRFQYVDMCALFPTSAAAVEYLINSSKAAHSAIQETAQRALRERLCVVERIAARRRAVAEHLLEERAAAAQRDYESHKRHCMLEKSRLDTLRNNAMKIEKKMERKRLRREAYLQKTAAAQEHALATAEKKREALLNLLEARGVEQLKRQKEHAETQREKFLRSRKVIEANQRAAEERERQRQQNQQEQADRRREEDKQKGLVAEMQSIQREQKLKRTKLAAEKRRDEISRHVLKQLEEASRRCAASRDAHAATITKRKAESEAHFNRIRNTVEAKKQEVDQKLLKMKEEEQEQEQTWCVKVEADTNARQITAEERLIDGNLRRNLAESRRLQKAFSHLMESGVVYQRSRALDETIHQRSVSAQLIRDVNKQVHVRQEIISAADKAQLVPIEKKQAAKSYLLKHPKYKAL